MQNFAVCTEIVLKKKYHDPGYDHQETGFDRYRFRDLTLSVPNYAGLKFEYKLPVLFLVCTSVCGYLHIFDEFDELHFDRVLATRERIPAVT